MRTYGTFRVYVPENAQERVRGEFCSLIVWKIVTEFSLCYDRPEFVGFEVNVRRKMSLHDFRLVSSYFIPINGLIYPWK